MTPDNDISRMAIEHYGEDTEVKKCIEECLELCLELSGMIGGRDLVSTGKLENMKAYLHHCLYQIRTADDTGIYSEIDEKRKRDTLEECADTLITINHVVNIIGGKDRLECFVKAKEIRLKRAIVHEKAEAAAKRLRA